MAAYIESMAEFSTAAREAAVEAVTDFLAGKSAADFVSAEAFGRDVFNVISEQYHGVFDSEDVAQAIRASGMNVTLYKAMAVYIASAMGCLSGACLAHIYMWSGISQFALDFSILPIAATVIGGGGHPDRTRAGLFDSGSHLGAAA